MKSFIAARLDNLQARLQTSEGSGSPRHRARLVAICAMIFLVALGVRLLYWQDSQAEILQGYSSLTHLGRKYKNEVKRMYAEGGILFPRQHDPGDAMMLVHPPGYSMLMRAMYGNEISGHTFTGLRLFQVLCDCLAAVLIFLIAIELLPCAVGIIAGMLVALSPHFAYYSLWNSPDSLAALPILLAVYLVICAIKRPRLVTIIAAGACLGLSCWLRSNGLLIAPLLAAVVFLLIERSKRWWYPLALVGATALVILPLTIRNWVVFHEFIPTSITTGLNLIQGIAEYDHTGRFGMPAVDSQAKAKDVEWSGNSGYRHNVWKPDGIKRDRERFARGLKVIRANPGWFFSVMLRRMGFMLRYNDARAHPFPFDSAIAPALSASPSFFHTTTGIEDQQPAWSNSPAELIAGGSIVANQATVALTNHDQAMQVASDDDAPVDWFASAPIAVEQHSDYALIVPVKLAKGKVLVKVTSVDCASTLGSSNLFEALGVEEPNVVTIDGEEMTVIRVPFATGSNDQVRIVLSSATAGAAAKIGRAELFALGPTPFGWTRPARAVVRAVQKPLYTTVMMLPLVVIGTALLMLVRQWRALTLLLAVPLYYLGSHAAFSVEYRYILAMHYFLFVMSAVTIYVIGNAAWRSARKAINRVTLRRAIEPVASASEA